MAINFNYSKVKDADTVLFVYRDEEPNENQSVVAGHWEKLSDGRWRKFAPWFDAIIMASMSIMPAPGWEISEKNVEKFIQRLMIYQSVYGALLYSVDEKGDMAKVYVTPDHVRSLVGLSLNISTVNESAFRANIMKGIEGMGKDLRLSIETGKVPV